MYEFNFGGEYHPRPAETASAKEWSQYLYFRENSTQDQLEWWYHQMGCCCWFLAIRNPLTNQVKTTFWPEDLHTFQTDPESSPSENPR